MAKKPSRTPRAVKPRDADDLKLINGIGPIVESRLRGVGIYTFTQLAALSPADIAAAVSDLAGLTSERIIKQDWIGQAHKLVARSTPTEPEWISQERKQVPSSTLVESCSSAVGVIEPVSPPVATSVPANVLHLREIETVLYDALVPRHILPFDLPFGVRLTLDLTDMAIPDEILLNYTATIYGRRLGNRTRQTLGEMQGTLIPTDKIRLIVRGTGLERGVYCVEATVSVRLPAGESLPPADVTARMKGDPIHIY
jgi:hypothetical protein